MLKHITEFLDNINESALDANSMKLYGQMLESWSAGANNTEKDSLQVDVNNIDIASAPPLKDKDLYADTVKDMVSTNFQDVIKEANKMKMTASKRKVVGYWIPVTYNADPNNEKSLTHMIGLVRFDTSGLYIDSVMHILGLYISPIVKNDKDVYEAILHKFGKEYLLNFKNLSKTVLTGLTTIDNNDALYDMGFEKSKIGLPFATYVIR
nr:MAG TPA: hypothetical protein [Caudoviricetes sp.]